MKLPDLMAMAGRLLVLALAPSLLASCRSSPPLAVATATTAASTAASERPIVLLGGTLYPTPEAPAIPDGAVLFRGGRIVFAGPRRALRVPAKAQVVDVRGQTVVAGFWNSHVHFTEPRWKDIANQPAAQLARELRAMLVRHGFVHVVDAGSFPEETLALRRRIESGEVTGPGILTAGVPMVPPKGTPFYVEPLQLPELPDPETARARVREGLAMGLDAVKLVTVPLTRHRPFPVMPVEVVRAVVEEAHARHRFVLVHPTNEAGIRVALEGGVDVLMHTTPISGPWSEALVAALIRARMALVPTLKLWDWELARAGRDAAERASFQAAGIEQLRVFAKAGGRVLFGSDVGYMTEDDPTEEYVAMGRAGLDGRQLLATLTTAPAAEFGMEGRTGKLVPGMEADVVVLDGDPVQEPGALSRVRRVYRAGRLLWVAEAAAAPR